MVFRKDHYVDRLIDRKIGEYLKIFGALSIEGPKWCGKTWASLNHANSVVYLDDATELEKAKLDLDLILDRESPELIDEWNLVPRIWDAIRHKCDLSSEKGLYLLTCSTKLSDTDKNEKIHHSGAGRIGKIRMRTMSSYEAGLSNGEASIMDMKSGKLRNRSQGKVELDDLADAIVRGGWPANQKTIKRLAGVVPQQYIESIIEYDVDGKRYNGMKMLSLLRSLARNESSIASVNTLLRDIEEIAQGEGVIETRKTLENYLDLLNRLYIIEDQPAFSDNYRSRERVGKAVKRHFTDPSLAVALLGLTQKKLFDDLNTFGLLFEALVERDLRVYMDAIGGKLWHFRDNVMGLEIDAILEFADGEYAAIEIKLGPDKIEDAKSSLMKFAQNMDKVPSFMCVVVGNYDAIVRDPETGIYIVPATSLGI